MKNTFLLIVCAVMAFSCKKESKPPAIPPQVSFTIDHSKYYFSQPVTFTNTSTGGQNFVWDFGDNTTSTEKSPTHAYVTYGEHKVTLTMKGLIVTKAVFIRYGTAGYVIFNNSSSDVRFVTFYITSNETVAEEAIDQGMVNQKQRTDTSDTRRTSMYLSGHIGTKWFTVISPYTLTKFATNIMEFDDDTPIVNLPPPTEQPQNLSAIQSLQYIKKQVSVTTVRNLIKQRPEQIN